MSIDLLRKEKKIDIDLVIWPSHDKIEGREGRMCWGCRKFRHLAQNCRNKEEEEKRETAPQNKFKVLSSRVM